MMRRALLLALVVLLLSFPAFAAGAVYTYDAAGRLIRVDYGGKGFTYTYDNNGNLLSRSAFESSRRRPVRRASVEKKKVVKKAPPPAAVASLH